MNTWQRLPSNTHPPIHFLRASLLGTSQLRKTSSLSKNSPSSHTNISSLPALQPTTQHRRVSTKPAQPPAPAPPPIVAMPSHPPDITRFAESTPLTFLLWRVDLDRPAQQANIRSTCIRERRSESASRCSHRKRFEGDGTEKNYPCGDREVGRDGVVEWSGVTPVGGAI